MFSPGLALCGLLGCSATAANPTECDDNEPCREAFGPGSVCDAGYCTAAQIPARCSRSFPEDYLDNYDAYSDRILIGSIFSYVDHNETLQAAELAIRQVNENGGLKGTNYAILHCDYTPEAGDNLDDEEATDLITTFLADSMDVPAIVGPRGSSRTTVAFEAVRDKGVVIISPSATSPALTALDNSTPTQENPGFLWRTAPPDTLQSKVIAADMRMRMVSNVAVLFQTGPYGDGLVQLFEEEFLAAGGGMVHRYEFNSGQDFSSSVAEIAVEISNSDVTEVLFVSSDSTDFVSFLVQTTATPDLETAFVDTLGDPMMGGGLFFPDAGFDISVLEDSVGQSASVFEKIRGTRPAPADGPIFNAFAASFVSNFGSDPNASGYTANSFDASWLVLFGTAWSDANEGQITGLGIARGLRKISAGPAVDITPSNWQQVVDHFGRAESINVRGASGSLDYDPNTEETVAPIELWHVIADPGEPTGYKFETISVQEPS
jgi:branched-chain amino acid transport system substrate-binding protein